MIPLFLPFIPVYSNNACNIHIVEAFHLSKVDTSVLLCKTKEFGYLPIMPVNARDSAGTSRDKQGHVVAGAILYFIVDVCMEKHHM